MPERRLKINFRDFSIDDFYRFTRDWREIIIVFFEFDKSVTADTRSSAKIIKYDILNLNLFYKL